MQPSQIFAWPWDNAPTYAEIHVLQWQRINLRVRSSLSISTVTNKSQRSVIKENISIIFNFWAQCMARQQYLNDQQIRTRLVDVPALNP